MYWIHTLHNMFSFQPKPISFQFQLVILLDYITSMLPTSLVPELHQPQITHGNSTNYIGVSQWPGLLTGYFNQWLYMYMYVCLCVYVCMHICIYIYIYLHFSKDLSFWGHHHDVSSFPRITWQHFTLDYIFHNNLWILVVPILLPCWQTFIYLSTNK